MALMHKVTLQVHPNSVQALAENASSRPSRVEITARGQTYAGEKRYPKGTPSPDPESFMTTDELVGKFRHNATGVLPAPTIDNVVNGVLDLENVADFAAIIGQLARPRSAE
jgi:2-methylcitrate dehydratase PrpD